MPTNVRREASLSSPFTLEDIEIFLFEARELGVPPRQELDLAVTAAYSDFRESWPAAATITAKA
jgi:hypothetical protein